ETWMESSRPMVPGRSTCSGRAAARRTGVVSGKTVERLWISVAAQTLLCLMNPPPSSSGLPRGSASADPARGSFRIVVQRRDVSHDPRVKPEDDGGEDR